MHSYLSKKDAIEVHRSKFKKVIEGDLGLRIWKIILA
jgi:hypothetical protein